MKTFHKTALISAALAIHSTPALAALTNEGLLDDVMTEFLSHAARWQEKMTIAASWLFWTLTIISMVWTFGTMALRKADIGEFFSELVRFTMFTGFFWLALTEGPTYALSIIESLSKLGMDASGTTVTKPSGIVDIGFRIFAQALYKMSYWSPMRSLIGISLSFGILLLLTVIAVNMLLLYIAAYLLAYAGIFFLGFGGSRWTSDMAINYYKTVLGLAAQIMTMILIIGIGYDMLSKFYSRMDTVTLSFNELGVLIVFCTTLLLLSNRLPSLVSGIISGASVGNSGGIGNFGAGAIIGAAMTAAGAAMTVGAAAIGAIGAGASAAAKGVSAIKEAFMKSSETLSSLGSGSSDNSDSGSSGGDSNASTGNTPFSQAAGFGNDSLSSGSSDSK